MIDELEWNGGVGWGVSLLIFLGVGWCGGEL